MNCDEVKKWAEEYLDDTLTGERKRDLDHHIHACSKCARELWESHRLRSVLASLEEEELPHGFQQRLHSRLQDVAREVQGDTKGFKWKLTAGGTRTWIRWGAGLAALFALAFSVYRLQSFGMTPPLSDRSSDGTDIAAEEQKEYSLHSEEMGESGMKPVPMEEPQPDQERNHAQRTADEGLASEGRSNTSKQTSSYYLYIPNTLYVEDIMEQIVAIAEVFSMEVVDKLQITIVLQPYEYNSFDKITFLARLSELGKVQIEDAADGSNAITIHIRHINES